MCDKWIAVEWMFIEVVTIKTIRPSRRGGCVRCINGDRVLHNVSSKRQWLAMRPPMSGSKTMILLSDGSRTIARSVSHNVRHAERGTIAQRAWGQTGSGRARKWKPASALSARVPSGSRLIVEARSPLLASWLGCSCPLTWLVHNRARSGPRERPRSPLSSDRSTRL